MQSLAGSIGALRRHRVASVFSAWRRWRYPCFGRGDTPLISAASANLKGDSLHSRFANEPMQGHTIIKDEEWPLWDYVLGETGKEISEHVLMGATNDVPKSNPTSRGTQDVINTAPKDNKLWHVYINPKSRHRDGTIYKERLFWERVHSIDVTNRSETRLDPMRYSVRTSCGHDPENCTCWYYMQSMVQIFSLKLAEISLKSRSAQLYGYIAARDDLDSMLNYVFYRSRDDPITVHQDSLIEMTGPMRGITLCSDVLFEFDMRIKNGEQEEDDLQLIDGIMKLYEDAMLPAPFTVRINGEYGSVDMCLANIDLGVEATVEVVISDVQNNFDLSLSSEVSTLIPESSTSGLRKEFQLFCGTIGAACRLRRFVLAVLLDTMLELKFKVYQNGSNVVECGCSFGAVKFGSACHQIDLEMASILVKVTWSTMCEY